MSIYLPIILCQPLERPEYWRVVRDDEVGLPGQALFEDVLGEVVGEHDARNGLVSARLDQEAHVVPLLGQAQAEVALEAVHELTKIHRK
jgi:hypothetical protein